MIRKAKVEDIIVIEKLIVNASKNAGVLTRSKKEISESISNFYVYEFKKIVVACCNLDFYNGKTAEIRSLVVDQSFRNKGIGTKLIKRCIIEAKQAGIFEILAITDKDKLFGSFGFEKSLENKWPMFIKLK